MASLKSVSLRFALKRFAPLRFARLRFAPLRFAPVKLARRRSAPLRFATVRLAPLRLAPLRSAPLRFASLRFAPWRSASLRFAPLRLAMLRPAPLRFAPLRSAPLRSAPLRSAPLRSALIMSGCRSLHSFHSAAPFFRIARYSSFAIGHPPHRVNYRATLVESGRECNSYQPSAVSRQLWAISTVILSGGAPPLRAGVEGPLWSALEGCPDRLVVPSPT